MVNSWSSSRSQSWRCFMLSRCRDRDDWLHCWWCVMSGKCHQVKTILLMCLQCSAGRRNNSQHSNFQRQPKILWHKNFQITIYRRHESELTGSPILFECLEFNYSFLMCSQLNCLETNLSLITSHRPGWEMARVTILQETLKKIPPHLTPWCAVSPEAARALEGIRIGL